MYTHAHARTHARQTHVTVSTLVTVALRCLGTPSDLPLPRRRAVTAGDDVLLQCELTSNLATPLWTRDGARLSGYGLDSGIRTGTDGLLIIKAQPDQRGRYTCHGRENGVVVAMVSYDVTVRLDATPPPPQPAPRPNLRTLVPADAADGGPVEERNGASAPVENHVPRTSDQGVLALGPPAPTGAAAAPLLPHSELLSPRNMKAMYLSLITVLGGLCVVLSVVLLYVGFCLRTGSRGHYSLRAAASAYGCGKKKGGRHGGRQHRNSSSSQLELKTVSSHCNGGGGGGGGGGAARKSHECFDGHEAGLLQIVPGEGRSLANHVGGRGGRPPPAPPLPSPSSSLSSQQQLQQQQQQQPQPQPQPQPPPSPEREFSSALSATLPSVLRRMNGNSYVLLRQSDAETPVANGYAFNDELSKMLEKRKHTQLLQPRPDESSV